MGDDEMLEDSEGSDNEMGDSMDSDDMEEMDEAPWLLFPSTEHQRI